MSDLIERLRPLVKHLRQVWRNFPRMSDQIDAVEALDEAADEIERLECHLAISKGKHTSAIEEIERLRVALKDIWHRAPTNGEDVSFAIANKALAEVNDE